MVYNDFGFLPLYDVAISYTVPAILNIVWSVYFVMGELLRKHVYISGRVQGVGFRWYTRAQARALGLVGWVRNLPDGRVEAVFQGSREDVESMLDWCHTGSPSSSVRDVAVSDEPVVSRESDFEAR